MSQSFEVRFLNRVAADLENLEKSENLKETSESQGTCPIIPKVRESRGIFCLKFIFNQVEDPNFENFLGVELNLGLEKSGKSQGISYCLEVTTLFE